LTNKVNITMEFDKILEMLQGHALSDKVKERIAKLEPFLSETDVSRHMNDTTEGKLIIEHSGTPPLSNLNDLEKILPLLGKGTFLIPEQLASVAQFLTACRRLKAYMKKAESTFTSVALYGNSIHALSEVEDEINQAVRGSQLDDRASSQLADIRRKIIYSGNQIKSKLDSLLRNNKIWFSEGFISVRNGHYTLPVKREYKNQVSGTVIDASQSGSTVFIEPHAARKLQEDLALLHIEEENETRRILYALTALVEDHLSFIHINMEAMETLDFIFAKAKLSMAMKAVPLPVAAERRIEIKGARHPLLKAETAVPLDFHNGLDFKGVVITGPNTGGKTVALKTIGLLSIMAQSGLHVPAEDGFFTMNNYVLCDIGDGQSITENLSTFSSHMTNIIEILRLADDQSLVLLDELGSGTDPAEGMGLAAAILEELSEKNCLFVATTHYPEIKEYAKKAAGLTNARMAFDHESLLPLYRLEIGEAGESCALAIARRLGLPKRIIERASIAAYGHKAVTLDQSSLVSIPSSADTTNTKPSTRRIKEMEAVETAVIPRCIKFNIGDSVMVYPQKQIGVVFQKADDKGEIGVQLKKTKQMINHKRLKLHVPADELYPENYDFSIIFDSVANRKARHKMERMHTPGLMIENISKEGEKW